MEKQEIITSEVLTSLKGADPLTLAKAIADRLDEKKGREVKVLAVGEKTSIADYFVLCSGNSSTHVKALAGEAEEHISKREIEPDNVEGRGNNSWIVLDYGNVVVHIFSREARDFYNLDKLYDDAPVVLTF